MERVDVYALHGFLGSGKDWQHVFRFLKKEKPHWHLHAIDVFADVGRNLSLDSWSKKFTQLVTAENSDRRIFLGYSMGGRLGLHAIESNPELWAGAVFLSVNPGLMTVDERSKRMEQDLRWAQRFSHEEFYRVMEDWNRQPVFQGAPVPNRKVESFERGDLVHALTHWSLGVQKNFRDILDQWKIRQMWVVGEKDIKFVDLLKTLPEGQDIQKWVVEEASHRLLFEAPEEVAHFVARVGSPIEI